MNHDDAPASGPFLFLRRIGVDRVGLAATLIRPDGVEPPVLRAMDEEHRPEPLHREAGATLWRYGFELPAAAAASYEIDGRSHGLATDFTGDLRFAYVSCNGQEEGDLDRPEKGRNALWRELRARHDERPIHLLLHGGDQIYADEVTRAHPLTRGWPNDIPERLTKKEATEVEAALSRAFFLRYATQNAQPGYAAAVSTIPSLAMWDDHDICDGWGSLRSRTLDSEVGRILYRCARDAFLLFQFGCRPDERPEICLPVEAESYSWAVDGPGFRILAPDLRATRRRECVMDEATWTAVEAATDSAPEGRLLVLSSVPALGPRLSLVERAMQLTRRLEKYEDDLRDQWQSRSHRVEWQRFLRHLIRAHERPGAAVTVLSGEIHLATRATMETGAEPIHQLVASGISHPAPSTGYAIGLGLLARFGEAPLENHPIRLHPLPGRRGIYRAERNFLMVSRENGTWSATWHLEESGPTESLPL